MAQGGIFYMDDPDMAVSALFSGPSNQMQNYISNSVSSYVNSVQGTAPAFATMIQQKYHDIRNSDAVRHVRNLKHRLNSIWQEDAIRYLANVNAIQQAPASMQRWVMACPPIRERWNNNAISGYDKKYEDTYPGGVGNSHYDYRRVTENIVMIDADNCVGYSNYYEEIEKDDDILSIMQKCSILSTWDQINAYMDDPENDSDPTSPWNSLL